MTESIKIVLLGESGTGKTSIIAQFTRGEFDPNVVTSISAQFISKLTYIAEYDKTIKFDIWDTAGQEKFRSLAQIFYKDAKAIILVYDITNLKSFEELKNYWYPKVKENCQSDIILGLAGNKDDLYENEQVSSQDAQNFADEIGAIYKKTSALNNSNIQFIFECIGKKYIDSSFDYRAKDNEKKQKFEKNNENHSVKKTENNRLRLDDEIKVKPKQNCCL
jgi:small GTP-binding protein